MADDRPTKTCPDCAETVLADARKCRFCGYRFDVFGGRAPASTGGLLGLLRRAPPSVTSVPELMDSWGIARHQDDGEAALCHGSISGVLGFIVVTQTRFLFVPAQVTSTQRAVREQHLLRDLLRVHSGRHRLRRALFIEWRDTRTIVQVDARQLTVLRDLLSPHSIAAPRGDSAPLH